MLFRTSDHLQDNFRNFVCPLEQGEKEENILRIEFLIDINYYSLKNVT
jgi:hypothetical protein